MFALRCVALVNLSVKSKETVGTNIHVKSFVSMRNLVPSVKSNALDRDLVVMNSTVLTNVIRNVHNVNNQSLKNLLVVIP